MEIILSPEDQHILDQLANQANIPPEEMAKYAIRRFLAGIVRRVENGGK